MTVARIFCVVVMFRVAWRTGSDKPSLAGTHLRGNDYSRYFSVQASALPGPDVRHGQLFACRRCKSIYTQKNAAGEKRFNV